MVRVKVPATTANLGSGFDCLGMALELHNTVEMSLAAGLSIDVQGEGEKDIARDERNVVYQAAVRLFRQAGLPVPGLKIRLVNQIPVARGLGSSAAAVVGGLMAANRLAGGAVQAREIMSIATAMEGHPDNVAPALLGGLVIAVPVDGEIKCIKLDLPPELRVVCAVPDFTLSTRLAREALPHEVNLSDAVYNLGRVALLVAGLMKGELELLNVAMEDRLHQPYRYSLVPGMKKVLAAARLAGARGTALSGAGPSLVALADRNCELIARVMRETFRQNGVAARSMVLPPCPVGAAVFESH
ncbi:MAG: homoserine kinase [Peptococcaceae bacterium]|jgi:homoserine kinase|nr:homoserine kinase [Peptococcaceae bacterium]